MITRWAPPALRRPVLCVVVKGGFAGRGGELPLADWITILDHVDQLATESLQKNPAGYSAVGIGLTPSHALTGITTAQLASKFVSLFVCLLVCFFISFVFGLSVIFHIDTNNQHKRNYSYFFCVLIVWIEKRYAVTDAAEVRTIADYAKSGAGASADAVARLRPIQHNAASTLCAPTL
ncbi:hypothetical protein L3N13_003885 [Salmonella enterica]|nr:hypothetical protein [Salmonella enterica]